MFDLLEPLNIGLTVRDLERARRFYGETLGLPLLREEPAEALHFGAGSAVLSVRRADDGELPPRGSWVLFTVAHGLDELCEALHGRGVAFERPLEDRPFGRSAMFRDPDGHELWICRPSATETQFLGWRRGQRSRERRVPVQRRPKLRLHERPPASRRRPHPSDDEAPA